MSSRSPARVARLHRKARGFSLIELGIVIAVIAVLASVVIFGRGFIVAARITKSVEASNTIRKGASSYAGLMGGNLPNPGIQVTAGLNTLADRQLLPASAKDTGGWTVAGSGTDAFKVNGVGMGQVAGASGSGAGVQNAVAVRYLVPNPAQAQDIYTSVRTDPNFVKENRTIGGAPCTVALPTSNTVTICFYL